MKKVSILAISFLLCTIASVAQTAPFTFIHLSDLHVSTVTSQVNQCDLNGVQAKCNFQTFRDMTPKPAFVLCTGDISNIGNSTAVPGGMYSALTQYLYPQGLSYPAPGALFIDSAKTTPIYFAPGNHEYYTTLTSFSITTQTLPLLDSIPNFIEQVSPDSDYAVTTDISVILFMRSGHDISYLISTDPKGSGYTDAQIDWMRTVLSQNANKRKIIVMHHPPADNAGYSCGIATFSGNGNDSSSSFYYNRLQFLDICDSFHVDMVLAGHVHQNTVSDRYGNQINENCDTCGTRFVQTGPAFAGCYRIITVDSSFISVSTPMLASCSTTGVVPIEEELEISVYPDPSSGIFNVSLKQDIPIQLKIYNVLGQCIHQQSGSGTEMQVNLSNQPDGMYYLQLVADQHGTAVTYNFKYSLVISK